MGDDFAGFDSRYWFTPQLLAAAASQSRLAHAAEERLSWPPDRNDEIAHRGFVTGAVLQSVAALESELWCVIHHGPGHQLGSGGTDEAARDRLLPVSDLLDRGELLPRYAAVLHILERMPMDSGANPWQDTQLLIRLRNELVHYKSKMASELDRASFIRALRSQPIPAPTFMPDGMAGWFPHVCLSAPRAAWAVETAVDFLDAFYIALGMPSSLEKWRGELGARPDAPT